MWAWINPLNLIKLFSLLKSIFDTISALLKAYRDRKEQKEAGEKAEKEAQDAINELQTPVGQEKPNLDEVPTLEKVTDYFKHRRNRKRP